VICVKPFIGALARRGFEPNSAAGFLFGFGCIAAAAAVRWLLGMWFGATLYFVAFFPAVIITALFAGFWPGMVALALSVAIGTYFFIPAAALAQLSPAFIANMGIYVAAGFFTVWLGHLFRSVVRQLQAEQAERELILNEVQHRARNMGALGAAIVQFSLKDNRDAADLINTRMRTLQSTNDLITRAPSMQPDIQTIVKQELAPYGTARYVLRGGEMKLRADIARAVALIVHELTTNAVKYGALSHAEGNLEVRWQHHGDAIGIDWKEESVSPLVAPTRVGFGTRLIETTVKGLNGTVERSFSDRTFACRVVLRL
jgi:two-component sensor histidine kinase